MPSVTSNRHITEGVIWKQILLFFFPILLGSFFQQLYNTVDAIIVGRALGTEALASVGASSPILNLVNGFSSVSPQAQPSSYPRPTVPATGTVSTKRCIPLWHWR